MTAFIIAKRVVRQLQRDKRFLALTIIAPLVIIYFLKLLLDTFPPMVPVTNFTIPVSAFIVHFLSFLLCAILLVQERTRGTLERMLIAGFKGPDIIGGYTLGYLGLATIQAALVLFESIWLFDLRYANDIIIILFAVIWLLSIVSVMLGIFISTFARNEGHVFPFIPLIILPSVFLTGLIIDTQKLPKWAALLGKILPLNYALNIIEEVRQSDYSMSIIYFNFGILLLYAVGLLIIASYTLREKD